MSMIILLKEILLSESTDKSPVKFYKKPKPTTLSELATNASKMGVNLSVGGINEIKTVCG